VLSLLRTVYFDLVVGVVRMHEELLGEDGETYDSSLESVGLVGAGQVLKVGGFRRKLGRALESLPGVSWLKRAFDWGNIVLGSLGGVPVVGLIADQIKELKEATEAQGEEDQSG
jgi:hypothetical protein